MTINDLINESGIKKVKIAEKLNVSMPTLYTKIRENDFDSADVYALQELFRLTDEEVLSLFDSLQNEKN